MRVQKRIAIVSLAAASVVMAGCVSLPQYGGFYHRKDDTDTNYTAYSAEKYEVLGRVTAKGHANSVLGLFVKAHEGEALLWDEAKMLYGDKVTGIKDITSTADYTSVLFFFWDLKVTYSGVAVHEK